MTTTTTTVPSSENDHEALLQEHLDWSNKQGRILTANGRATDYYCAERGFCFHEKDLPHYRLLQGDTSFGDFQVEPSVICGAWSRAYFCGGWEHSNSLTEHVWNVQTNSLFVDLRIPTSRNQVLPSKKTSLQDYTDEELRLYARQHVFGGYSRVTKEGDRLVCTRHHCLDWNFCGIPRTRPNKWWIEVMPTNNEGVEKWKEWAYATDDNGQHYYCEMWERCSGGSSGVTLALRKSQTDSNDDGILVVVGSHFNYIRGHALVKDDSKEKYPNATSPVALVDAALEAGDRDTAIAWLDRIEAGHGRTDRGWILDCAIQPWKEGSALFSTNEVVVDGDDIDTCRVLWNGETWHVFESSMSTVQELRDLLQNAGYLEVCPPTRARSPRFANL